MSKNFLAKKYQAEPEEDIFGSGGVTWDDVIYLNIGDPDILTPKVALQAAFENTPIQGAILNSVMKFANFINQDIIWT